MQQNDYVTIGANANLRKIAPFLGTLSVSRTNNKYTGSTYTNVDYDQSLLANRYATVSLRAGIQNYQYNNHENLRDKYVNIDVSIPSLLAQHRRVQPEWKHAGERHAAQKL